MVLFIFAIAGILIGLLRGGSFRNTEKNTVKGLYLPIVALLSEALLPSLFSLIHIDAALAGALTVVIEYGLLLVFIVLNVKQGLWSLGFGAGTLLNLAVIAANGWRMPVSVEILKNPAYSALAQSLKNGEISGYILASGSTRLPILGDILLGLGVAGLAFRLLCPAKHESSPVAMNKIE